MYFREFYMTGMTLKFRWRRLSTPRILKIHEIQSLKFQYFQKLTLTSASVVIFFHKESSPKIEIICAEQFVLLPFVFADNDDEMQMRHNCKLFDKGENDEDIDEVASMLKTLKRCFYKFFAIFFLYQRINDFHTQQVVQNSRNNTIFFIKMFFYT